MINYIYIDYESVKLRVEASDKTLTKISFVQEVEEENSSKYLEGIRDKIVSYLRGELRDFDLDIELDGSEFQKRVWNELMKIPYGQVKTYKDVAIAIGNPKASRAVGMACNRNKLPIVVPCHRVVGSSGKLTGFAGGLGVKEKLLNIEKSEEK